MSSWRPLFALLLLACLLVAGLLDVGELPPVGAEPVRSRHQREEIFYRAEAAWNDRDTRAAVVVASRRSIAARVDAPYAYLARSLAALADGHKGGDRFDDSNYLAGSLDVANRLAISALTRAPDIALAHAHRGFLDLIAGDLEAAKRALARARQLESSAFHTALYSAVLEEALGKSALANELLSEAERSATHPHHFTMLNRVQVRVARANGDRAMEEELHLENIAMNPSSAHAYGSYADFLLRERRFEEALGRYEKATAIQRYPAAVRGLEKAQLRVRLAQPRRSRSPVRSLASSPEPRSSDAAD